MSFVCLDPPCRNGRFSIPRNLGAKAKVSGLGFCPRITFMPLSHVTSPRDSVPLEADIWPQQGQPTRTAGPLKEPVKPGCGVEGQVKLLFAERTRCHPPWPRHQGPGRGASDLRCCPSLRVWLGLRVWWRTEAGSQGNDQ